MEPLVRLELSEFLAQRARRVQPGSAGQQVLLELLVSQEPRVLRAVMAQLEL